MLCRFSQPQIKTFNNIKRYVYDEYAQRFFSLVIYSLNNMLAIIHIEFVLVRVAIAVMKHQGQKQVGEESIYLAYTSHHSSSLNGVRTETQTRQEPGDRN